MSNQLTLPNFSSLDLAQIESQLDALIKGIEDTLETLLKQVPTKTWSNFIQPLDDSSDKLHRFWSVVSHLSSVKDSPELRAVYDACLPKLTAFGTRMGHHRGLFEATKALQDSSDFANWSQAQRKTIENSLRDFHLAGVDLSAEDKVKMQALTQEKAQASLLFSNQVLDATEAWHAHVTDEASLAGLPAHVCQAAKEKAGELGKEGFVFTLDFPVYYAVQSYATDRELRETMHRAYVTRASDVGPQAGQRDNGPVIGTILDKRRALSQLMGYPNYATYALQTKMVSSPEQVTAFLEDLARPSLPKAKEELAQLQAFATSELGLAELMPWDIAFASEALRKARFDISQEQLRPYFQLPRVLDTLSWLLGELFGLSIEPVLEADTWHADVNCYRLIDGEGNTRSYYYMDLYARSGKRGGAWMDDLQGRRRLSDGSAQTPIALINCNFTPPSGSGPVLLGHDEVETLFHEFGHALQHMLTTVDCPDVAGINGIPWDAVEFPSQFFENWIWEAEILSHMTCHVQTNEPLSTELMQRMHDARHFQSALKMLRQLEFALFDMRIHANYDGGGAAFVAKTLDEVRAEVTVVNVAEPNRFQNGFSHIFDGGYAAGYYSYKWAEVMAVDAFMLFRDQGLFNKKLATLFLSCVLEPGGSEDPADLFRRLAGRDPDPQALLRHDQIITGNEVKS